MTTQSYTAPATTYSAPAYTPSPAHHGQTDSKAQERRVGHDHHRLTGAGGSVLCALVLRADDARGQRPFGQQQPLLVLRRFVEPEAAEQDAQVSLDR